MEPYILCDGLPYLITRALNCVRNKTTIIMKRYILFIFMLLLVNSNLKADDVDKNKSDAHIFGHVLEKSTKEHLPYVTIKVKGTTIGVTTDATGHYFLRNLPVGNLTIEVSMIGFRTISQDITIKKGMTYELNFELDEGTVSLDEVVVSANRNNTTRRQSSSLVSVMGVQMLEATSSKTLSDGLKFQPGLRVENNCQNCGTTQLRINGLEGPYSQIMIDSRPVIGALSGIYSLEQIPANMIERIEVIRGGGSVLLGGNAIGGAVNIVTREPIRNSGEFSHTITGINGSSSFENNTTFNASIVNDSYNAGVMVFGQYRDRDAYDIDGDGFSEIPVLKNRALGFHSFLKTSNYSKITLEYKNMHEFRRGGDSLNQQPYRSFIAEQAEHGINSGSLKFDQFTPNQKNKFSLFLAVHHTDRKSYYGAGNPYVDRVPELHEDMTADEIENINTINENNLIRINSFGKSEELSYQIGGHYTHMFDKLWFMPSELTSGIEYFGSNLKDQSGYRKNGLSQQVRVASAFAQNEWKTDMWGFLIGVRADNHNMMKKPIVFPRANVRYNPNENVNLRLTYSEGYRAPQIFDEDLHVDIAGGDVIIRELSANLKEEHSHSVSGSVDTYAEVGMFQVNALVEGFYTRLRNPFTDVKRSGIIYVENSDDGAQVYGINLEGRVGYRTLLDLQLGATFQRSLYDNARKWWEPESDEDIELDGVEATREMMRTPDVYAYFVATWTPITQLSASLSGNYTGRMYVPHEAGFGVEGVDSFSKKNVTEHTPSFFELNLRVSYDFNIYNDNKLQLNAGVQNIFNSYQKDFDTGAGRASKYVYGPGMPRSFFAGVKVTF